MPALQLPGLPGARFVMRWLEPPTVSVPIGNLISCLVWQVLLT